MNARIIVVLVVALIVILLAAHYYNSGQLDTTTRPATTSTAPSNEPFEFAQILGAAANRWPAAPNTKCSLIGDLLPDVTVDRRCSRNR